MGNLIIRDAIRSYSTERHSMPNPHGSSFLPTKKEFIDHIASDKTGGPGLLPLRMVSKEGKEFSIGIYELDCSSDGTKFLFWGYCDFRNYGLQPENKDGGSHGLRLISGRISFRNDGTAHYAAIDAMREYCYHRN